MMRTIEDFGQLYRNALAEREPEKKTVLLRQVQARLDQWQQGMRTAEIVPLSVSAEPVQAPAGAQMLPRGVHERSVRSAA